MAEESSRVVFLEGVFSIWNDWPSGTEILNGNVTRSETEIGTVSGIEIERTKNDFSNVMVSGIESESEIWGIETVGWQSEIWGIVSVSVSVFVIFRGLWNDATFSSERREEQVACGVHQARCDGCFY